MFLKTGNQSRTCLIALAFLIFLFIHSQAQPTFSDNCLNFNTALGVCQQCNSGFYLEYFLCITCNPRCSCSSAADFCDSCLPVQYNNLHFNSYQSQQLNQCLLCNASIPFCLSCKNLNYCTQCYNGQYLVQSTDLDGVVTSQYCSTNVCTLNCQFCRDSISCSTCQPGYFLFANNTCSSQPCDTNCSICQSLNQCEICIQGYYLQIQHFGPPVCVTCIGNCQQCTTSTDCQVCSPSYYLSNGTCVSSGLASCSQYANSNTQCTGCQPGYQVTTGTCNQCTGCLLCRQQFICLSQCLPGYQPFNFACIPVFQIKLIVCLSLLMLYIFLMY